MTAPPRASDGPAGNADNNNSQLWTTKILPNDSSSRSLLKDWTAGTAPQQRMEDSSQRWHQCNLALQQLEAQRRALQHDFKGWMDQLGAAQQECEAMQRLLHETDSGSGSLHTLDDKVVPDVKPHASLGVLCPPGTVLRTEEATVAPPSEPPPRKPLSQMRQGSRQRLDAAEKLATRSGKVKAMERNETMRLSSISNREETSPLSSAPSMKADWSVKSIGSNALLCRSRSDFMRAIHSEHSQCASDATMSSNTQAWAVRNGPVCLKVKIVSAKGLPKSSSWLGLDTCDPYCQCSVVGKTGPEFETRIIKNVLDPVWNHEGYVYDFSPGQALTFSVWDKDRLSADDLIGSVTLDSDEILPTGFEGELDINDANGIKKGCIRLKVSLVRRRLTEAENVRKLSYGLKKEKKGQDALATVVRSMVSSIGLGGSYARTDEERHAWQDRLQSARSTRKWQVVHGTHFQMATSLIILVHVVLIGTQADTALKAKLDGKDLSTFWDVQGAAFGIWFAVELFIRFCAEGQFFFNGPEWKWNLFDFFLLCVTFVDVIARATLASNVRTLRSLRLLRLIRIFRLVKVMRAFQSLRLLVNSITGSMVSLLWCLLVLIFIIFIFAIFFIHGVTEHISDHPEDIDAFGEEYGSLLDTMVTLFQTISGGIDWKDAMSPLRTLDWYYRPSFLVYIFFMFFGVLNVVIGAFVATTAEISSKDRDAVVHFEMQRFLEYRENIKSFFLEADKDHSGMLSWDEFEAHLQADEVKAYFQALELDVSQAHVVFKLLDEDGSDQVGLEEFFDGCMRLKGSARSIDVNLLLYENQKYMSKFNEFSRHVSATLAAIEDKFHITVPSDVPSAAASNAVNSHTMSRSRTS